jgi:hypothetical protein
MALDVRAYDQAYQGEAKVTNHNWSRLMDLIIDYGDSSVALGKAIASIDNTGYEKHVQQRRASLAAIVNFVEEADGSLQAVSPDVLADLGAHGTSSD